MFANLIVSMFPRDKAQEFEVILCEIQVSIDFVICYNYGMNFEVFYLTLCEKNLTKVIHLFFSNLNEKNFVLKEGGVIFRMLELTLHV